MAAAGNGGGDDKKNASHETSCLPVAFGGRPTQSDASMGDIVGTMAGPALALSSDTSGSDRGPASTASSTAPRQLLVTTRGVVGASTPSSRLNRGLRSFSVAPEIVRLQYRELTPEDYELLCILDEALPKAGTTSQSTVSRLPCMMARDCLASECHICLCELQPHTRVAQLPCQHVFHQECISRWLTQCNGKCPLCMLPIECVVDSDLAKTATAVSLPFRDCSVTEACAVKSQEASLSQRPPAAGCNPQCGRWPSSGHQMHANSVLLVAGEDELQPLAGPAD